MPASKSPVRIRISKEPHHHLCNYGGYTLRDSDRRRRQRALIRSLEDGVVAYKPLVGRLGVLRTFRKTCRRPRPSQRTPRVRGRGPTRTRGCSTIYNRLDADLKALHDHVRLARAREPHKYKRPPFRLVSVTFEPKVHDLASQTTASRAVAKQRVRVHRNDVVAWYRHRLRDYVYCSMATPHIAKRYTRVEPSTRGRISIVFPVPADADESVVQVERACIADPDDDGNSPLVLTRADGSSAHCLVGARISARKEA